MSDTKNKGFIPEFKKFIQDRIPANEEYLENISVSALSAVANKCFIPNKIYPINLKFWYEFIAPASGVKTIPLNYLRDTIKATSHRLIALGINDVDLQIPENFSPEGIGELLATQKRGVILYDEASMLYKQLSDQRSYNSQKAEILSKIFDGGDNYRNFTRGNGKTYLPSVWINFFATCTPYVYSYMNPEYFRQGLCNRILYGLGEPKRMKLKEDNAYWSLGTGEADRTERIASFANILARIYRAADYIDFEMSTDAGKLSLESHDKWEEQSFEISTKSDTDIRASYIKRIWTASVALAGLNCLSRNISMVGENHSISNRLKLEIKEEDVKYGIDKTINFYNNFEIIQDKIKTATNAEKVTNDIPMIEAAKEAILKDNINGYVTQKMLYTSLGWTATGYRREQYNGVMKILLADGFIQQINTKSLPEDMKTKLMIKNASIVYKIYSS